MTITSVIVKWIKSGGVIEADLRYQDIGPHLERLRPEQAGAVPTSDYQRRDAVIVLSTVGAVLAFRLTDSQARSASALL